MKKFFLKWYLLCAVCVCGFFFGYMFYEQFTSKVNAKDDDGQDNSLGEYTSRYEDIFSSDMYSCAYNEERERLHVLKKTINARTNSKDFYSKEDIQLLVDKILDIKYEWRLEKDTKDGVRYREYKDGYPTGAYFSCLLDEEGYILEAYFRKGSIYSVDETSSLLLIEAFEIVVSSIKGKYGPNTVIDGNSEDYTYRVFYNPNCDKLCYEITEIVGHIAEKKDNGIDPIYFFAIISLDGEYIEVGSTLGY